MYTGEYRFKFYLNARHHVNFQNIDSKIHPHTWELVLHVKNRDGVFMRFSDIEADIRIFISSYEGKCLNEIEPFNTLIPTMENMGEVFAGQIEKRLTARGWQLLKLEISESPARTYIVVPVIVSGGGTEAEPTDLANHQSADRFIQLDLGLGKMKEVPDEYQETPGRGCPNGCVKGCAKEAQHPGVPGSSSELHYASNELSCALSERQDASSELPDASNELSDASSELPSLKSEIQISSSELQNAPCELRNAPGELQNASGELQNASGELQNASGELQNASGEIQNASGELQNAPAELQDYSKTQETRKSGKKLQTIWYLLLGIFASLAAGAAVFWFITRQGSYPWGSDSWYHLFKGHLLYESIKKGNFFPLYSDIWYNGIQPLRYWAPLPHYILAALEFVTGGNTALSYNLFIMLVFTAGAAGWLLWGLKTGRHMLAFLLALLWFFLPDNLRVLFSEGNLSRVAVTTIFPFLLLSVSNYFIASASSKGRENTDGENTDDKNTDGENTDGENTVDDKNTNNKNTNNRNTNDESIKRGNVIEKDKSIGKDLVRSKPARQEYPIGSLVAITGCMLAITLCHAMISAMVAVAVTLFALLYSLLEKKLVKGLHIVTAVTCGIASAGIWLVPALSGGLLGLDGEAVKELAQGLTYPALDSLNPLLRLIDPNVFYFGITILAAAVFGLLFGNRKSKAAFAVTILIFAGTTKALLPIIIKLPLSQAFWMMRFTPLAMGLFFAGLMMWKGLKKSVLAVILALIIADSAISFSVLAHDSPMPETSMNILKPAAEETQNRLALFDGSRLGSFPGFYLRYNLSEPVKQVFGSGWQGAATAQNIMWLNTALEKHWYAYLFDRSLEQGADTVTITKTMSSDEEGLRSAAEKAGYKLSTENASAWTYKYPVGGSFGTIVRYKGLGIGKYAAGLSLVFPQIETGGKENLDDYTLDELLQYKVVYLSGFGYKDKTKAEELVTGLSERGVKVLVDLNNASEDLLTSRAEFLGVVAENAVFEGKLPSLDTSSGRLKFMSDIPQEYPQWRTHYLENLDSVLSGTYSDNQQMDIIGTKKNDNIVFVGLNLPYYTMLTGDSTAVKLLEAATGLEAGELPERETVRLDVKTDRNTITVHSDKGGVMTGIAALDTFTAKKGSYIVKQNFVYMQGKDLVLEAGYPEVSPGLAVSVAGLIGAVFLIIAIRRKYFMIAADNKRRGGKVDADI